MYCYNSRISNVYFFTCKPDAYNMAKAQQSFRSLVQIHERNGKFICSEKSKFFLNFLRNFSTDFLDVLPPSSEPNVVIVISTFQVLVCPRLKTQAFSVFRLRMVHATERRRLTFYSHRLPNVQYSCTNCVKLFSTILKHAQ